MDEFLEHAAEALHAWSANAAVWDAAAGTAGTRFHQRLIEPDLLRLLAPQPGEAMLGIGCGNGVMARVLAAHGVTVLATDFSPALLERAQQYPQPPLISYQQLDATDSAQLLALGAGRFAGVVASMVLMDMAAIEPLFQALSTLLQPGGRFVFTVQHPCFNNNSVSQVIEHSERNGQMQTRFALKVERYLTPWMERGLAVAAQTLPHPYFQRPISVLLQAGFAAGLVADGFEEPAWPVDAPPDHWEQQANFAELPLVLLVRMRKLT